MYVIFFDNKKLTWLKYPNVMTTFQPSHIPFSKTVSSVKADISFLSLSLNLWENFDYLLVNLLW